MRKKSNLNFINLLLFREYIQVLFTTDADPIKSAHLNFLHVFSHCFSRKRTFREGGTGPRNIGK